MEEIDKNIGVFSGESFAFGGKPPNSGTSLLVEEFDVSAPGEVWLHLIFFSQLGSLRQLFDYFRKRFRSFYLGTDYTHHQG